MVHYLVVVLFEIEESFQINLVISKSHNFWDIFHKSNKTQIAINLGLYCWKSSFLKHFCETIFSSSVPSTKYPVAKVPVRRYAWEKNLQVCNVFSLLAESSIYLLKLWLEMGSRYFKCYLAIMQKVAYADNYPQGVALTLPRSARISGKTCKTDISLNT